MKLNKYFGTLLFAGALLAGCSKATDTLPQTVQDKPEAEKTAEESQVTEIFLGEGRQRERLQHDNRAGYRGLAVC